MLNISFSSIYVCPVPLRLLPTEKYIILFVPHPYTKRMVWRAGRKLSTEPGVVILTFFYKRSCWNHTLTNCFLAPHHELFMVLIFFKDDNTLANLNIQCILVCYVFMQLFLVLSQFSAIRGQADFISLLQLNQNENKQSQKFQTIPTNISELNLS